MSWVAHIMIEGTNSGENLLEPSPFGSRDVALIQPGSEMSTGITGLTRKNDELENPSLDTNDIWSCQYLLNSDNFLYFVG